MFVRNHIFKKDILGHTTNPTQTEIYKSRKIHILLNNDLFKFSSF